MSKVRVGLDLDGVVYDFHGCARYLLNKHRGLDLPPVEAFWHGWNALNELTSKEDRKWLWTHGIELGLFRYGHHLKGAVDGIRELAALKGAQLEFVTHRPKSALVDTLRFIEGLPPVYAGVHVLSEQQPKSSAGCHVYIDDAPHVIREVSKADRLTVIVKRPWNVGQRKWADAEAETWEEIVEATETLIYAERDSR